MKKSLFLAWMLLFFAVPLMLFSQTRQISGVVLNNNGEPVPLATIIIKGTNNSTTADENGRFTINATGNNLVLVVSSVSYASREITVGTDNSYNIRLSDAGDLREVVVTALGIRKEKKALGYSAQEIKGADLAT